MSDPIGILLEECARLGIVPIAGGLGGGKQPKPPTKNETPTPDPEAEAAKKKAAEERSKISQKRGTSRTIATGPQGVLGAAPTSRPELKGTLG